MKTWAWILGGAGVAAGAWWYFKGRNPMTSATSESSYPEGVVPGVTPGYPAAPSADQLPPDTAQQMAPAMGESYALATQSSQASSVSAYHGGSSTNTPSSSGAPYAMGAGTGTSTPSPKTTFVLVKPSSSPIVTTSYVRPISSSPRPVVAPQPTKVAVTTYRSPVTSATRTVIAPVVVAPRVVAVPKPRSPAPAPVVRPLTRPQVVVRPTALRGVYAVGADFTEAEYRAMAVKAELESRRREWAANEMAEQANALARR